MSEMSEMSEMSAHSSLGGELRLLLLGERLSGKSSAGDAILATRAFDSGVMTTRSRKRSADVAGRQVTVVDTPGWDPWWSSTPTPPRVAAELERAASLSSPAPHAILLAVPVARPFGPEAWRAMETHLRAMETHLRLLTGAGGVWSRALVLFTRGAVVGMTGARGGEEAELITRMREEKSLQWLVERCCMRYHVLDSHSRSSGAQVQALFEKVDRMVAVGGVPPEARRRMYAQVRQGLREERERQQQGEERRMMMMMKRMGTLEMVTRQRGQQGMTTPSETYRSEQKPSALSFILLGRRVSGKSSVGNTILHRGAFETDRRTVRCAVGRGEVAGTPVTVVDTPGWSLFGLARPEQVRAEIGRSASLCAYGSRVTCLLAVPVDSSFTEKERRGVEKHLGVLGGGGEAAWGRAVVLFTSGDRLKKKRSIQEHIEKRGGEALRWVLTRCGHRYHVFDNRIRGDVTQVIELLEMVELL